MESPISLYSSVEAAPADPILGLTDRFNADVRPGKVNLGVGVYQDERGKLPLLECVRSVEMQMGASPQPRGYLPIDGLPAYRQAVTDLVLGEQNPAVQEGRMVVLQTLSGTGALKIGADFLHEISPASTVLISAPSWENHRALFTRAGFEVAEYRYYNPADRAIDLEGMLADLGAAASGTIVVLHPCCHNPTGYDPTPEQWDQIVQVVQDRHLVPFVDMAYQGFSHGVEADGAVVRRFVETGLNVLVSVSFSKNFSLYGERVGALAMLCADAEEARRVLSRVKVVVRTNYSNPPTHGARVVTAVLSDPELRELWETELGVMRDRIRGMRLTLVDRLAGAGVSEDMSFITRQAGMFSYSGLSRDQMVRLREEFAVYGTDRGRICIAALNESNIQHVCHAMAAVMRNTA